MTNLFDDLKKTTAPKGISIQIFKKIHPQKNRPTRLIWATGLASIGIIFLTLIGISNYQESLLISEIADTYTTIDNPWVIPADASAVLLQ